MELTQPSPRAATQAISTLAIPAVSSAAFVVLGALWPRLGGIPSVLSPETLLGTVKILAAISIGFFLSAVQRRTASGQSAARPLEQAQVLLCLAGALVVMLIGDSLARAVGIIGGASLIRFRTPIDDPKDATVLFLLLGLGMATGLGHFGVAGLATLVVGLLLLVFGGDPPGTKLRTLTLQIVCSSVQLPSGHVESVLRRYAASFEPREISKGERPVIRYQVALDASMPLAEVSQELMEGPENSIQSLSWDTPKKERFQ